MLGVIKRVTYPVAVEPEAVVVVVFEEVLQGKR